MDRSAGKSVFMFLTAFVFSTVLVLSAADTDPLGKINPGDSREEFIAEMEEQIPALMDAYEIPGASIALVKGSRVVWTRSFGFADMETGRKMTPETVCRVQSVSKPVTAWGVMKLAEQQRISLDTPVSEYLEDWSLPGSEFREEEITVRQLLSHTAGLPLGDILTRYDPRAPMVSLEEKLVQEAHLMQEPGTSFSYSNTGYNLLELLIEEVTGTDFSGYMENEILLPLGMERSDFDWDPEFDPPVPKGYNLQGEEIPVYVYPERGSGGLFSTAEDIARFVAAGMDEKNPVLSRESIGMLYSPEAESLGMYSLVFDAYGLGYYLETLHGGMNAVSHGGQGTGWMTHFHAVPEAGDAIVILTNSQRSWPFIAHILASWSRWSGFGAPGMENILIAQRTFWGAIWLLNLIVTYWLLKFTGEIRSRNRRFAPLRKSDALVRAIQAAGSILIFSVLIWCVSQPYLTITSLFPIASRWLAITFFILGILLLVLFAFPGTVQEAAG